MRQKLFAFGLILAGSIAGAAWALQPAPAAPGKNHVVASDATATVLMVETPADTIRAADQNTATGHVSSVDVSESRVTLDLASGSSALASINTGDPVRVQLEDDAIPSADASGGSNSVGPRRLLGLWLLAITGTTVVLRARRSHTI